ncbi:DUF456 family protein [Arthrobacter sp. JZ12]|uniref:DUF456 domain-containing protein n=1 Tax=Arthrobacter sp. JZ12 TaxID=2654190 RepID=UPI002B4A06BB|nr:DUF456 domain-containing protein [Arthrobacter sp. JZ12]WRH26086.1 DUF456 family protein [Arthrobacter sp. JZ12]
MDLEIVVTVLCGLAIGVGVAGVVVPVLPGSILIIGALLAWALTVTSGAGWTALGVGGLCALAGLLAGIILTGRRLRERRIPGRSITIGLVLGVVGMFVIPVVGLFVGFTAGLLLSETARLRDLRSAASSSVAALKAMGLGILVELALACAAGSAWIIAVWVHFATR